MITPRRAQERHHDQRREQQVWQTFCPRDRGVQLAGGLVGLEGFSENRLPPGAVSAAHPRQEAEIVTYIYKGALAQEDSTGSSGVVHAGEFQRMTIGRGIRHKETNASRTDWAHIFRISLRPTEVGLNMRSPAKALRGSTAPQRAVCRRVPGRADGIAAHPPGRRCLLERTRPWASPCPRAVAGTKRLAPCHLRRG